MADTFLEDRLTATKNQILAYEAAIDFLIANPTKRYKLDTGQSSQEVTRQDLTTLQDDLDKLYSRYETLEKRCNSRPLINAPGW